MFAAIKAVPVAGGLALACTASTVTGTGSIEGGPRPIAVRVQGPGGGCGGDEAGPAQGPRW
ncbi:hypothetical protein [Nocardia sp. alder85J]|uniref:hypothetical protein n=1 Tax=Nocardia sp. alder85J TaxID=2862949 RepID=UPI001CD6387D|nr:hypothetical protein [Nocardia sp. alder85J]MCX4097132.1 hypothetical protein [Nocardia sp. alder85J]